MSTDTPVRGEMRKVLHDILFGTGCGNKECRKTKGDCMLDRMVEAIEPLLSSALLAEAERAKKKLAAWMIEHSFATGHGDTTEDLLKELAWQVKELRGAAQVRR